MFHLYLSRTVTMFGAFALLSLVSGVADAQSGTSFGGGSASRVPTPAQFGGGSGTTQFGGGGSGTTQFSGGSGPANQFSGGSGTTNQFGGGSGTTNQAGGGSGTTNQFSNGSGSTNQSFNQQGQPEQPLDCSNCGLPPVPNFNNCGWHYPQLQRGSRAVFPNRPRGQSNCCN